MADVPVYSCRCPACQAGPDHGDRQLHHQINLLMSRLDEQQRRWLAALESKKIGHGGDTLVALIVGLHVDTIRRGRQELDADRADRPTDRIRKPGAVAQAQGASVWFIKAETARVKRPPSPLNPSPHRWPALGLGSAECG